MRSITAEIAAVRFARTKLLGALLIHEVIKRSNVSMLPAAACCSIVFKSFVSDFESVIILFLVGCVAV
tara:strand:+ start:107 stop:310 length:204 start_codon:yes stop_codon:yes gene_type:complete